MKNYEKYAEKIKKYSDAQMLCDEIRIPLVLHPAGISCASDMDCDTCQMLTTLWLLEEYEEPETDWSKVEVDTPILVKEKETHFWNKRYFAKYEDGAVWSWFGGRTSWNETVMDKHKYAKLAETEGAE